MVEKNYYNFTSPIGRLVSGSPDKFRTTNAAGEPLIYKSGANKGQPKRDYAIGVAYQKAQRDVPAFMRQLKEWSAKAWPELFDADLNCSYDNFADKIIDGDSTKMNNRKRRPCDNPDWKGCWIVWFSSDREPECVSKHGKSSIKPSDIKTGYFIRVKGSTVSNGSDTTPGMYMNLEGVELWGYGPEIDNRPDVREAFRTTEVGAIPEGMSEVPLEAGDEPVHTPAPPPAPPKSDSVLYQGVRYKKSELLDKGWSEAQIASLPVG